MNGAGARRIEVLSAGVWRVAERLSSGDVFRVFTEAGTPVADEHGVTRWRALAAASRGEIVSSEPLPETDAELAIRTRGWYWPGDTVGFPRGKYSA